MEHKQQPTVGEYVRQRREEAGLSIRELARRADIDFTHLSRIEKGEKRPTAESLQKIGDALGIDSGELLAYAGIHPSLPEPRAYFRRKLGVDADEAEVLARLIEDYQANKRKEGGGNHEETNED